MNRRQVLRGLATLPVVSVLNSCRREEPERPTEAPTHTVEVHLDGAFAVVVQQNKNNSILAFSPRDPSEPHKFYVFSPENDVDAAKNYRFKLSPEGLEENRVPEIQKGFEDFFAETDRWHLVDSVATIELPCPKSISFSGHRELVTFVDGRQGFMPTNHIFRYSAKEAGHVKLLCNELQGQCQPSEESPGLTRFFLEVGPARGSDDAKHTHAINYFNFMLKAVFPDLVKKYSIARIGRGTPGRTSGLYPRLMPASFNYSSTPHQLMPASYIVDCTLGGFGGKTGSGPTGGG